MSRQTSHSAAHSQKRSSHIRLIDRDRVPNSQTSDDRAHLADIQPFGGPKRRHIASGALDWPVVGGGCRCGTTQRMRDREPTVMCQPVGRCKIWRPAQDRAHILCVLTARIEIYIRIPSAAISIAIRRADEVGFHVAALIPPTLRQTFHAVMRAAWPRRRAIPSHQFRTAVEPRRRQHGSLRFQAAAIIKDHVANSRPRSGVSSRRKIAIGQIVQEEGVWACWRWYPAFHQCHVATFRVSLSSG